MAVLALADRAVLARRCVCKGTSSQPGRRSLSRPVRGKPVGRNDVDNPFSAPLLASLATRGSMVFDLGHESGGRALPCSRQKRSRCRPQHRTISRKIRPRPTPSPFPSTSPSSAVLLCTPVQKSSTKVKIVARGTAPHYLGFPGRSTCLRHRWPSDNFRQGAPAARPRCRAGYGTFRSGLRAVHENGSQQHFDIMAHAMSRDGRRSVEF